MDAIINAGRRAVILPIIPKFKLSGSDLNTGEIQREEDFGYASFDDETVSTVSEESYCEESVPMVLCRKRKFSNTENSNMETKELEVPMLMYLPFKSLKVIKERQCRLKQFEIKTDPKKLSFKFNRKNILRIWELIHRPGYDPEQFPFLSKEEFLKEYGDLYVEAVGES